MKDVANADPIFSDPKLAQIYDSFDSDRGDLNPYIELIRGIGAKNVADLGCGTGVLALLLADEGVSVTGVDPAGASIDVAKSKPGSEAVQWIVGDASSLSGKSVDAVTMTGNVAQAIIDPKDWQDTLKNVNKCLVPGGYFVFETRKPEAKAWINWTKEKSFTSIDVPGQGMVDGWVDLISINLPLVSFRWSYYFHKEDKTIISDSTLRYRSAEEITNDLEQSGFLVEEVREAPDRPGKEFVFVARNKGKPQ